ncbi:KpsS protein [Oceanobacter sp. RED65]|uniref:KpsS protein n=2 Tax=Bermanella marisrubri TaxID=207949 RepID=Q1N0A3_9GAMM|nr:KpsS protein [Oceanobacter sp. RED65] [Bermanella marisrubri]
MLQGPLGPFFSHLSHEIAAQGDRVYRISFNGGDRFYQRCKGKVTCIDFNQSPEQWPQFLTEVVTRYGIRLVIAYGDCRLYHIDAKHICLKNNLAYVAFEEGYLRPNYITLEKGGVNAHSPISHSAVDAYRPVHTVKDEEVVPANFLKRLEFAILYYLACRFLHFKYAGYKHHRGTSPIYEGFCWVRAGVRKLMYKAFEKSAQQLTHERPCFLVPLQVHNDAQIRYHSHYDSMEGFIVEVMESYAKAKPDADLIIKHHPMDRGYVNYRRLIRDMAKRLGISKHVRYIHDQHLPTLLKSTLGVITINSTTALQAFYHGAPVKVMGRAFFDMPGLTDQKTLREFWSYPEAPDPVFADRFRAYLLDHGQINGSFYCEFEKTTQRVVAELYRLGLLKSGSGSEMDTQRQSVGF